jgi:GNAT superfamily N-acetyltransferase
VVEYELRPARDDDAGVVAAIWATGWRDGHLGNVPEALVAAREQEPFPDRAARRVDRTVVAETVADGGPGEVAGFVMVAGDEIEQVYVAADHRGTGVAGLLLAEAERCVAAAGHGTAWLAVVDGNVRARRFYERRGWTDDGMFDYAAAVPGGTVPVPCHRYTRQLHRPDSLRRHS